MEKKDIGGRTPTQIAIKKELIWLISDLRKDASATALQSTVRTKRVIQKMTGMLREKVQRH